MSSGCMAKAIMSPPLPALRRLCLSVRRRSAPCRAASQVAAHAGSGWSCWFGRRIQRHLPENQPRRLAADRHHALAMFDIDRTPASLLQPGSRIKFRDMAKDAAYEIQTSARSAAAKAIVSPEADTASIEILSIGLPILFQDLGRAGQAGRASAFRAPPTGQASRPPIASSAIRQTQPHWKLPSVASASACVARASWH